MLYLGDARSLTEYRSDCRLEEDLKKQAGTVDDYRYKVWLQQNADTIIKTSSRQAFNGLTNCKNCGNQ